MDPPSTVTVAAAQLQARPLERADDALDDILRMIRHAGRYGVDLLVLPECSYPAYHLRSRATYDAAPVLRSDGLVPLLSAEARSANLHLVVGLVETYGSRLYNSAAVIGPAGQLIGVYRKQCLWDFDHDTFDPGDAIPVFETLLGRIGVLICADARVPEIPATLAAERAELIAMPTNWVNVAKGDGYYNPQPDYMIPARCREFGVPFVCANKAGEEDDVTRFCGLTRIVDLDGSTLAEAEPTGEAIVVGEISTTSPQTPEVAEACRRELCATNGVVRPTDRVDQACVVVSRSVSDLVRPCDRPIGLAFISQVSVVDASSFTCGGWTAFECPEAPQLRRIGDVMVGCVAGADADAFCWPRTFALQGVHIVCLFDARSDMQMLRTRAIENRIFVAAATSDWVTLIGPDGTVLGQDERHVILDADLGQAANKIVAPRTDIFDERRPESFRF